MRTSHLDDTQREQLEEEPDRLRKREARAVGHLHHPHRTRSLDLAAFLDTYYRLCSLAVKSHHGRVVKFMGDACFAVFSEAHCVDAVDCALDVQLLWVASCTRARPSMTDDDPCRGVRAHAHSLEEEVALMRGVVAALRASPRPRRKGSAAAPREQSGWKIVTVAFIVGVVVGALTLIALTRSL